MLKRDYLVKQFEEFGKVMAVLLGLKKDGLFPELSDSIEEALKKYTSLEIKYVESISNEILIETLTQEKKLNDEQLKMLADLMYEKGEYYSLINSLENTSSNCYKKAFLIYLFLKENATLNYSLDMHYKLEILEKMEI
jgi:hypothetical protein